MRFFGTFWLAVIVVLALFWAMHWMIRPPEAPEQIERNLDGIEIVKVKPEEESPEELQRELDSPPPPPPSAPPALSRPEMPTINVPAIAVSPVDVGNISVPVALGANSMSLSGSGTFGGFSRGSGAGSGTGSGQGFKGKPLIPLSTARPQMPEWACKQGIRGWVEVVFTVMPNGRVQDVKLVDADPRGVFEAAAIESISNWIYASADKAREVKQRVPMKPEDCAFNWQ